MDRSRDLIAVIGQRPKAGPQAMFDGGILQGSLAEFASARWDAEQEREAVRSELNILRDFPPSSPLQVSLPSGESRPPATPEEVTGLAFCAFQSGPLMRMRTLELAKARLQRRDHLNAS